MRAKAMLTLALSLVASPVHAGSILHLPPSPLMPVSDGWSLYRNERFGFSVEYPSALFVPEPSPANDDGQTFRTRAGRASLRVSGRFNSLGESLEQVRAAEINARSRNTITYNHSSGRGFVLSGYAGEDIFYVRVELSAGGDVINTLEVTYPRNWKGQLDPAIARISRSFRAGRPAS